MSDVAPTSIARLRTELAAAVAEVSAAEEALEAILVPLRAGVRAEKIAITAGVEAAFERVRAGRAALAKLYELIATD